MTTTKTGLAQSLGVAFYCALVAGIMNKGGVIFGTVNNYFGPLMFLLLFSVSVLICALLVFYQPYKLFFGGKKRAALEVVVSTTIFLFLWLLVLLSYLIIR